MKNEYVLFTPLGMSDPITHSKDGPLLHICRKYRPKVVCMYCSKEVCELKQVDDRYKLALDLLGEEIGCSFETIEVERPELNDVHLFDTFYTDFENILSDLESEFPDFKILLNTSSGTPAMKSALYILAAFSSGKYKALQVSSPSNYTRTSKIAVYDVNERWGQNLDNLDGYTDRVEEVQHLNLLTKFKKEMLIRRLEDYEYNVAYEMGKSLSEHISDETLTLLKAAKFRFELNLDRAEDAFNSCNISVVKYSSSLERDILEYLLWLQIKQERNDLLDFIRGISPCFFSLCKMTLLKYANVDLDKYCDDNDRFNLNKLESDKIGKNILSISNKLNITITNNTYVSSFMLVKMIIFFVKDLSIIQLVDEIRNVEKYIRNIAAHKIVCIDNNFIKKRTNMTPKDIMDKIKSLAMRVFNDIDDSFWCSYETMNSFIMQNL